jgi:hypothetical protein
MLMYNLQVALTAYSLLVKMFSVLREDTLNLAVKHLSPD